MRILNVRLGLATNSSSTHSLIFLPGAKDALIDGESAFGWDNFVCASPQAKKDYLAAAIFANLSRTAGQDVALTVARAWSDGGRVTADSYIDHDSHLDLPRAWDGQGLDLAFVEEFRAFLLKDGVVVLGGNDNDEEPHPLKSAGPQLGLEGAMPIETYAPWVARKDPAGYWTLFNRQSGAKLRVVLDESGLTARVDRSAAPELCDIKLTNFCPYGCKMCYMDSTVAGKHAEKDRLSSIAYALGDMKVFEVALGGGEPTLHPHFEAIVDSFAWKKIVVNFTTKNLTWLRAYGHDAAMRAKIGAIAFSADTAAEVDALAKVIRDWPMGHGTYGEETIRGINVQHVIGLDEKPYEFEALLRACVQHKLRLTLLGFKTTGRGAAYQASLRRGDMGVVADMLAELPPDTVVFRTLSDSKIGEAAPPKKHPLRAKASSDASPRWLSIVAKVCKEDHLTIGIDTALADRHWQALLDAGVPEWCMTRKEGRFSCYIDAVAGTIGPSSYCEPDEMKPLPQHVRAEDVRALYQSFAGAP